MDKEIKDISNTYEVVTLNPIKITQSVVKKVRTLTQNQTNVLFWELLAKEDRTIRSKALLSLIKEIEDNVK